MAPAGYDSIERVRKRTQLQMLDLERGSGRGSGNIADEDVQGFQGGEDVEGQEMPDLEIGAAIWEV